MVVTPSDKCNLLIRSDGESEQSQFFLIKSNKGNFRIQSHLIQRRFVIWGKEMFHDDGLVAEIWKNRFIWLSTERNEQVLKVVVMAWWFARSSQNWEMVGSIPRTRVFRWTWIEAWARRAFFKCLKYKKGKFFCKHESFLSCHLNFLFPGPKARH